MGVCGSVREDGLEVCGNQLMRVLDFLMHSEWRSLYSGL